MLKLIFDLQKQVEPEYQRYADALRQQLHGQVKQLEDESFLVRQHLRVVEKYRYAHQFNPLNELNVKELLDHLVPIVFEVEEDNLAKRFDQLCYTMELDWHGTTPVGHRTLAPSARHLRAGAGCRQMGRRERIGHHHGV